MDKASLLKEERVVRAQNRRDEWTNKIMRNK
jgi:hypothetical protein